MPVTIDKLLGKPLLHNHTDKVDVSGDTMTGELDMQDNAIILQASDNSRWRLTIDTSGALITEINNAYSMESGEFYLLESGGFILKE